MVFINISMCSKWCTCMIFVNILVQLFQAAETLECVFRADSGGVKNFNCEEGKECCGDQCCKPKVVWWPYLLAAIALLALCVALYMLYDYCRTSKTKRKATVSSSFVNPHKNTLNNSMDTYTPEVKERQHARDIEVAQDHGNYHNAY